MIIDAVRLIGLTTVDLPIEGALPTDQFILKGIEGLGPPETDVFITDGVYQGRQPQTREIVARIGLNPDWGSGGTAQALRTTLYGMLTPSNPEDPTEIRLRNDAADVAKAYGYIKRFEINPFSKDPEVQITWGCTKPLLEHPTLLAPSVTGWNKTNPVLPNLGTAPTGFLLKIKFTAGYSLWSIWDNTAAANEMEFDYDFLTNDILSIDTREGFRNVLVDRGGAITNLLPYLTDASKWLQLHGGNNTMHTSGQNFTFDSFFYTPQYWGI